MILKNNFEHKISMPEQLEYEILKLLPAVLLYFALFAYGMTLCIESCLCCSNREKPKFIHQLEKALIYVSFDIFFTDNSQQKIVQDVMKDIGSKDEEDIDSAAESYSWLFKRLLKVSYAVFSTLPIMLIGMTAIVFWRSYILFETDDCLLYVNDTSLVLECFTDASGPLSCGAILQLGSKWYNCYTFAYDLKTASATAGGILVTTIASNKYLYLVFASASHTIGGSKSAFFAQGSVILSTLAALVPYVLQTVNDDNPTTLLSKIGKISLGITISYIILAFSQFPWFFKITPQAQPTRNYQWLPNWLQHRDIRNPGKKRQPEDLELLIGQNPHTAQETSADQISHGAGHIEK